MNKNLCFYFFDGEQDRNSNLSANLTSIFTKSFGALIGKWLLNYTSIFRLVLTDILLRFGPWIVIR